VHNFDIHKGGLNGHFIDENDVTKWLQEVGKLAGSALYENKEKKSLDNIELYIMKWRSTKTGLIYIYMCNYIYIYMCMYI
jgi:hypothetical protein